MLKSETHGTQACYDHGGCRCDACRRAHNDYHSQRGENLRVGKRGEAKRRWDDENRAVCACGNRMARKARVCQACDTRVKRAAQQKRDARIAALWADGLKLPEIAAALDTTVNAVGTTMVRMRKDGWDLPYRYTVDETGRRVA